MDDRRVEEASVRKSETMPNQSFARQLLAEELQSSQASLCIRWHTNVDMPETLQIELKCFEYAWTEEDFRRRKRQSNCLTMVAELGDKVIGYMVYELYGSKIHLLNFAVDPEYRRLGVGGRMVAKLVRKLSSHRRNRITLAVRETNLSAQLFFKAQGFRAIKILRVYYEDSGEDAFLMQYRVAIAEAESK